MLQSTWSSTTTTTATTHNDHPHAALILSGVFVQLRTTVLLVGAGRGEDSAGFGTTGLSSKRGPIFVGVRGKAQRVSHSSIHHMRIG